MSTPFSESRQQIINTFSLQQTQENIDEKAKYTGLETVKPWFYKPRKSRFGLDDEPKKGKRYNSLHWSPEENLKYIDFLKVYSDLVNGDTLQKRKYHLNRMLSKHIGSRSPVQCRSHHQKMMKAFQTPEAIIAHFYQQEQDSSKPPSHTDEPASHSQNLESGNFSIEQLPREDINNEFLNEPVQLMVDMQLNNDFLNAQEAFLWDVLTYPLIEDSFNDF